MGCFLRYLESPASPAIMLTMFWPPPIALITSIDVRMLIKMSTEIWLKNFSFASSSKITTAASHCPRGVLRKTVKTSSPDLDSVFSSSISCILFRNLRMVWSDVSFFNSVSALVCSCLTICS